MAAQALVERGDGEIEREEVIEALSGHLCRCTGYVKIVDAVTAAVRGDVARARVGRHRSAGRRRRHPDPGEPGMKAVGARLPRYDGIAHVTGRTQYVDDVRVHGTLWCKALRSPHHSALIRLDRHEQGAGACPACTRSSPTRTCPTTSTATSRASASPPTSRCWPRTTCAGRASRSPPSPPSPRRSRRPRSTRSRSRFEEREPILDIRTAADPGAGEHFHQWGPIYPHFGPHNHRRVRKGDVDGGLRRGRPHRRGRLPPAGDRALPAGDAGLARGPRAQRPADDLLLHAGDVLLDGRRRRAPAVAAEQAEVRRRHRRRRLRRQGRHGDRDDLRAAGASRRAGRSSGASPARRSS